MVSHETIGYTNTKSGDVPWDKKVKKKKKSYFPKKCAKTTNCTDHGTHSFHSLLTEQTSWVKKKKAYSFKKFANTSKLPWKKKGEKKT